jgi:hypothetical protein
MLVTAPEFPLDLPAGYQELVDEFRYDPDLHLSPEFPDRIWTLDEFGYSEEDIASCASNVAVTSPFRLLSDQGVSALHKVATRLKSVCTHLEGGRVPRHLTGGVYRSRFLRDFCACPVVLEHMSAIGGTALAPHSMPSQQLYINYAPDDVTKAVDAWHFDGIGYDYVIMLSDPTTLKGGNFEYFQGTREEVAGMFNMAVPDVRNGILEDLPRERVIKANFPAAGYAIFQQGNMVVHRASRLLEPADRITVVPGLVSKNITAVDPTAKHDIAGYGEPGIFAELGRHSAWLAQAKLNTLINNLPMSSDPAAVASALQDAVCDITETINQLNKDNKTQALS